jgi:hypothetical protein
MDPHTGALYRKEELEDLDPATRKRIVPIPGRLLASASALLDYRDQLRAAEEKRKKKNRARNKAAQRSKKRNRRGF